MTRRPYSLLCLVAALAASVSVAGVDSPHATRDGTVGPSQEECAPPALGPGVGEGRNDPVQFPVTVGELRIGMLFVDFADVGGKTDPRADYEWSVPRAKKWYRNVSYDRLRLTVTPFLRRLTLGGTVADYRTGGGAGIEAGLRAALEEAIAAADAEVDFSRVHALYLVLPFETLQAIGGSGVLLLERPIRVDGAEVRTFAVLFDGPGAEPDYIVHETGHILGLPDLYVVGSFESFHRWDVMASTTPNRGLFAWHRWKLGWLKPAQIACLSGGRRVTATLSPLERPGGTKAVIVRRGRFAYVAEAHQRVRAVSGKFCRGGVLIYEVEFGAPHGVADIRLRRARFDSPRQRGTCGPLAEAPFGRGKGEVSRLRAWGLQFDVLAKLRDGSYRIRVTRTR
jgi:M6 family metalloprotease-like protein